MARRKINPSLFEDSSSLLELSAFKKKIKKLYDEILERVFKAENPGASPEEVQAYVEENGLQFPDEVDTGESEEEIDNLMEMLDDMVDTDIQEPISDISTEDKPKEYKGNELTSKSHEKGELSETIKLKEHMGGLFQVKTDSRSKTRSKSLPTPSSGSEIKRESNVPHPETFKPLVEKFRDELRSLADRQRSGVQQFRDRI